MAIGGGGRMVWKWCQWHLNVSVFLSIDCVKKGINKSFTSMQCYSFAPIGNGNKSQAVEKS